MTRDEIAELSDEDLKTLRHKLQVITFGEKSSLLKTHKKEMSKTPWLAYLERVVDEQIRRKVT